MIEVQGLTKSYGSVAAVGDLSFSVAPGEVLGLVGPNGAGKTTTLRSLAGIVRPAAGTIRIGGHDMERRLPALLQELELSEKAKALPGELSRGMKQKLVIGCGLLHDPSALLFDEPLTGLDPAGIRRMKQTIRERAQQGAAVVLSSHLLHLVEEICTRVLIMQRGRKVVLGTIEEILTERPDLRGRSLEDIFLTLTGT